MIDGFQIVTCAGVLELDGCGSPLRKTQAEFQILRHAGHVSVNSEFLAEGKLYIVVRILAADAEEIGALGDGAQAGLYAHRRLVSFVEVFQSPEIARRDCEPGREIPSGNDRGAGDGAFFQLQVTGEPVAEEVQNAVGAGSAQLEIKSVVLSGPLFS